MQFDFKEEPETLFRLVLLTLLYLLPLPAATRPVVDPDIWWHLRTGQWIVEHGAVPRVDLFSTYGMGKPWVAYSWLFDVLVYGFYQSLGLVGIVLYTTLFSLLVTAALHRLVRRFALPFGFEILLTGSGIAAMMFLFNPRPWLITMLLFIVEVDLILMARRSGNSRSLWLLLPLFVVWANVHIQFSYGLFLLGLAAVEPLIDKIFSAPMESNSRSIPLYKSLPVLIACFVATLVTPYLLQVYSTLLSYIQETAVFQIIIEFQPLPFRDPSSWFVLFSALGAAFSLGRQRNVRPFSVLALVAGIFLSFRARRDVWFVVGIAIPIIAASLPSTDPTQRFRVTKPRVALVSGALIIALIVIGWKGNISGTHLESVVGEYYPAAAAAVVKERGYQGPLYNSFDWGGYLIWRLPSIPVVIDNRTNVHGGERIRRSMETWSGFNKWDSDPELLSARLVIANVQTALASLLRLDSRFELVYEDKVAAVFIAREQRATGRVTTSQPE